MYTRTQLQQIAALNRAEFPDDERLNNADTISGWLNNTDTISGWLDEWNGGLLASIAANGDVKGYIVFYREDDKIILHRKAVDPEYRRQGVSKRLSILLIKIARREGRKISTYTARTNLTIGNTNIALGFRITRIGKKWVRMVWSPNT